MERMNRPVGTGPGAITEDGCAVDVYLKFPVTGEPDLVHANVPEGASVLDLGAGVGRVADPLARLGHRVVAVDESAEMLAHVQVAEPVLSRIEDLALGERFGAVLMASHLANVPDVAERRALFAAAARHLKPTGTVFVQWHDPEWFATLTPGTTPPSRLGPVTTWLDVHSVDGGLLDATVHYSADGNEWTQSFTAARVGEERLSADLAACGLGFGRYLTANRTWFSAHAVQQ
jgi:SAM-dependent methyltransferase